MPETEAVSREDRMEIALVGIRANCVCFNAGVPLSGIPDVRALCRNIKELATWGLGGHGPTTFIAGIEATFRGGVIEERNRILAILRKELPPELLPRVETAILDVPAPGEEAAHA